VVERDVILAKVAALDRCIARIEAVRDAPADKYEAIDRADLSVLNLQRAAQLAIDIAAHVVATEALGLPKDLGHGFTLLAGAGIIDAQLETKMRKMVGFRNIAVHRYQEIDPAIVQAICARHLDDLRGLAATIIDRFDLAQ